MSDPAAGGRSSAGTGRGGADAAGRAGTGAGARAGAGAFGGSGAGAGESGAAGPGAPDGVLTALGGTSILKGEVRSDPRWRDSEERLCPTVPTGIKDARINAYGVWSDTRGVFVLANAAAENADAFATDQMQVIFHNNGTGWQTYYNSTGRGNLRSVASLSGFEQGSLMITGVGDFIPSGASGVCGMVMVDQGQASCVPGMNGTVSTVHVVDETLAYAVLDGLLLDYDGTAWGATPAPPEYGFASVWGNHELMFAAIANRLGTLASMHGGEWRQEDVQTLEAFSVVWGFASDDVWAGTVEGSLFHYDGDAWTEVPLEWSTEEGCYPVIRRMWGAGDTLYVQTGTSLARVRGSEAPEVILQLACDGGDSVRSIWGNAPDELFVATRDIQSPSECEGFYLLHYDGDMFHVL